LDGRIGPELIRVGLFEFRRRSTRALVRNAATLALLAFFIASAHGAEGESATGAYTPPGPEPQRPELRSFVDSVKLDSALDPRGVQFGTLKLYPYISFEEMHTDNARRAPNHEVDDDLVSEDIGFTSQFHPHECIRAALNYDFGWHDYVRNTERDYPTQQAAAQLSIERIGVKGMSVLFYDNFLLTSSVGELENEIQQFAKYDTNLAGMTALYKFNRFKISGTYEYNFLEYAAKENSVSDYHTDTGRFDVGWEWLPGKLEIFDTYQLQRTFFDHAFASDFDTDTFLAGVRGRFSKLTYSVGVGYEFSRPLYKNGVHGDAGYNATLAYAPHRRIAVDVTGSRNFQAGVLTGSSLETNTAVNLKILLTQRGFFTFGFVRNQSDRLDGIHQISIAYSPRFEYKIARRVSLFTGYSRIERTSNDKPAEFKIDEVRVGAKLSW